MLIEILFNLSQYQVDEKIVEKGVLIDGKEIPKLIKSQQDDFIEAYRKKVYKVGM